MPTKHVTNKQFTFPLYRENKNRNKDIVILYVDIYLKKQGNTWFIKSYILRNSATYIVPILVKTSSPQKVPGCASNILVVYEICQPRTPKFEKTGKFV